VKPNVRILEIDQPERAYDVGGTGIKQRVKPSHPRAEFPQEGQRQKDTNMLGDTTIAQAAL
jgi:hypothetical protein